MKAVQSAIERFADDIARLSEHLGRQVCVDRERVADRSDAMALAVPGEWSANRSCRLLAAADGWIAVSLPRASDIELLPAWLGSEFDAEPWSAVEAAVRTRSRQELLARAHLLGLAVAGVGEIKAATRAVTVRAMTVAPSRSLPKQLTVIDLSSLWAGPLCGALLASMGASVLKIETHTRPDAVRASSPQLFDRLNGQKSHARIDLADPVQVRELGEQIAAAHIVITSARARAFEQIGLSPKALFGANPQLIWVAITGYGWMGPDANRVGFGDDTAAAGGLLRWNRAAQPRFLGDALADPLTGLAATAAALAAVVEGGGKLIDAALARTAAAVAA
jgi:crotonobetainyl-CoA:carnitine CoA-transferase CaiB-like acyl-CoA transferase